jgi:tryptophan synthase alpha subunit
LNRIDATFAKLKAAGRTALIPYVTTGDPSLVATRAIMNALVAAGADVIELGVPFSDPMADGPVIQRAGERALAQGVGLSDVLDIVRDFRGANAETPIVLMGYANPIEAMGVTAFADRAKASASTACWSSTTRRKRPPILRNCSLRAISRRSSCWRRRRRKRASRRSPKWRAVTSITCR